MTPLSKSGGSYDPPEMQNDTHTHTPHLIKSQKCLEVSRLFSEHTPQKHFKSRVLALSRLDFLRTSVFNFRTFHEGKLEICVSFLTIFEFSKLLKRQWQKIAKQPPGSFRSRYLKQLSFDKVLAYSSLFCSKSMFWSYRGSYYRTFLSTALGFSGSNVDFEQKSDEHTKTL